MQHKKGKSIYIPAPLVEKVEALVRAYMARKKLAEDAIAQEMDVDAIAS